MDFTHSIELNPRLADAFSSRGLAYYYIGNNEKALADAKKALSLDNQYADAYYLSALVKSAKLDKSGALADLSKAKALFEVQKNERGVKKVIQTEEAIKARFLEKGL